MDKIIIKLKENKFALIIVVILVFFLLPPIFIIFAMFAFIIIKGKEKPSLGNEKAGNRMVAIGTTALILVVGCVAIMVYALSQLE